MLLDLLGAIITDPGGFAGAVSSGVEADSRRRNRDKAADSAQEWLKAEKELYLWKKGLEKDNEQR